MSRNRYDGLLARVDFPLYTLQALTARHVIVAGGGGSSNTGVANGFEIFELSHNGTRFVAEEVMRYETGPNVVMTCSVRSFKNCIYMTAGQESHCQLYKLNMRMVDAAEMRRGSFRAENGLVRRRRRTVSENDNISKKDGDSCNSTEKRLTFEFRPHDSVQTDFSEEPLQRVVRISHDGKLMATGGIDSKVRVWTFPKMELLHVLEGHSKELDDLDFSPCDRRLVSVGKDGRALVWAAGAAPGPTPPQPLLSLECRPPNGTKYLFRRCRFGMIEDKPGEYRLFTIANPISRSGRQAGLLQSWDEVGGACRSVGVAEPLAALAVRDDGRYVGVGTMYSGSVHVYIAFSLKRVLQVKNAHMMFVTGVEFVPVRGAGAGAGPGGQGAGAGAGGQAAVGVASNTDAALLSISVDNCLCVHSVPTRSSMPAWFAIFLIIFTLFCTFNLLAYLGI